MKQKYFPKFKNYSEFHKILYKNDLLFQSLEYANNNNDDYSLVNNDLEGKNRQK